MTWAASAQREIKRIMDAMPADATLADRQKALRAASGSFTQGTSWGAKIWPRECRRYLEAHHGLPKRTPGDLSDKAKAHGKLFADDITFPFRGQSDQSV